MLGARGADQVRVERCERYAFAPRQFHVARIIDGEPLAAAEREHLKFFGGVIDGDPKAGESTQEGRRVGFREPPSPLVDDERLRTSNHQRDGTRASSVRMRSSASAAVGWSSSAKAQQAAIEASRTNGISICAPRDGPRAIRRA